MLDHPELKVSDIRPKLLINLLSEHTELNDLCLNESDDDGIFWGCFFGASKPSFEHKEGTDYGKRYGTATYHRHNFMIRINGKNLFVCKEHLKFLSVLSKELAPLG